MGDTPLFYSLWLSFIRVKPGETQRQYLFLLFLLAFNSRLGPNHSVPTFFYSVIVLKPVLVEQAATCLMAENTSLRTKANPDVAK